MLYYFLWDESFVGFALGLFVGREVWFEKLAGKLLIKIYDGDTWALGESMLLSSGLWGQ